MATTVCATPSPVAVTVRSGRYLTFHMGREEYGIAVRSVREILAMQEITGVPQAPGYVRGVVNLRGSVISVVDLRTRLGLAASEDTARTCIVVVDLVKGVSARRVGVIVDDVSEVLNVAEDEIEDAPDFGGGSGQLPYIIGMAKAKSGIKILLAIEQILGSGDLANLASALESYR